MIDSLTRARNVVFDVGQVLLSFCPEMFVPRIVSPAHAQLLLENLFKDGVWARLDEGTISEEDASRLIALGAGVPAAQEDALKIIRHFHEYMRVLPPAGLIAPLRQMGKKLYVLSNFGECAFARAQARFSDLFASFDGLVISGREKLCKPDPRIYALLLSRYGLQAGETAFIDDMPPNVQAARAAGIHGILYTGMDALE